MNKTGIVVLLAIRSLCMAMDSDAPHAPWVKPYPPSASDEAAYHLYCRSIGDVADKTQHRLYVQGEGSMALVAIPKQYEDELIFDPNRVCSFAGISQFFFDQLAVDDRVQVLRTWFKTLPSDKQLEALELIFDDKEKEEAQ